MKFTVQRESKDLTTDELLDAYDAAADDAKAELRLEVLYRIEPARRPTDPKPVVKKTGIASALDVAGVNNPPQ